MKDDRHLYPWGKPHWTCDPRSIPVFQDGGLNPWWGYLPHALLLIWAALCYFESLREWLRETVPVVIGAWSIYAIVRFANRRDDPREQKRPPDAP